MKHRHSFCHKLEHEYILVYLNSKLSLTIKNIEKMSIVSIEIQDNQAELVTLVTNFQTAFIALQNSTLSGLSQAITDLDAAQQALAAFQISFTASVPNTTQSENQ